MPWSSNVRAALIPAGPAPTITTGFMVGVPDRG